jgi:hypothetical protein
MLRATKAIAPQHPSQCTSLIPLRLGRARWDLTHGQKAFYNEAVVTFRKLSVRSDPISDDRAHPDRVTACPCFRQSTPIWTS